MVDFFAFVILLILFSPVIVLIGFALVALAYLIFASVVAIFSK